MPREEGARRRVVLFAPHYAEYATRLAFALAAEADVLLVAERANLTLECRSGLLAEARKALRIIDYDAHSRLGRMTATARIPVIVAAFRSNIIHVQEQPDMLTSRVVRILRWIAPVVLTVHDPRPHSGRDAAYARRQNVYRQRLRAVASAFHVHGSYCHQELAAVLGVARPIVSTLHGVILCPTTGDKRPPEPGRILFFGRMEAYKGLEVLLDAADELRRRGAPCRFTVAGRGPELDRLRGRVSGHPLIEVIEKFLTPEEATEHFQRASVIVAPYHDATQSGVVAAAVGNGRATVASEVGGLVDALGGGECGVLVAPGRPDLLADALADLALDGERWGRLTAGARAEAIGRFSWRHIAGDLINAYEACARREGKNARCQS